MNTITLEATGCFFRWTCDVCGEMQEKDGMKSQVNYDGEGSFDVCRNCLEAGPEGMIKRGAEHADRLQKYVDALRTELPEVVHNIAEWKTGADYDAQIEAFNDAFVEECAKDEGLTVEEWKAKHNTAIVDGGDKLAWETEAVQIPEAADLDEFPF
ncbi:MAG: hypothetical protein JW963_08995 [Anaerolineales bacterium]|nr:hypothetical protein [Anaerolineales bacterium]